MKPMGNSFNKVSFRDAYGVLLRTAIHKHCAKGKCTNCISMKYRNIEGQCICGNNIKNEEKGKT
jgi:hypothetical protein